MFFLLFLKLFLFGNETFISKVSFSALLEPSSDLRAFYTLEAPELRCVVEQNGEVPTTHGPRLGPCYQKQLWSWQSKRW